MLDNCVVYGRIILSTLTAFMLQNVFQSFLVTAERPQLGLAVTVAAGVANMVLDFVFIAVFHWGIAGAAASWRAHTAHLFFKAQHKQTAACKNQT